MEYMYSLKLSLFNDHQGPLAWTSMNKTKYFIKSNSENTKILMDYTD